MTSDFSEKRGKTPQESWGGHVKAKNRHRRCGVTCLGVDAASQKLAPLAI